MKNTTPGWQPDPTKRHEYRYFDGSKWTDDVSDKGTVSTDRIGKFERLNELSEPSATAKPGSVAPPRADSRSESGDRGPGAVAGSLLDRQLLVVNQKAKLIELTNHYRVFDEEGVEIGSVNQVGQSGAAKVMRLVSNLDQFMTTHLDVSDDTGRVLLRLTRPAKVFKSSVVVSDGEGRQIGTIKQKNMIGKINFALLDGQGAEVGEIKAENWRAWDFRIEDSSGVEVARVSKTWGGMAKEVFTTADNYVVQIHKRLVDPLRSLVVASALSIDTALKQDSR